MASRATIAAHVQISPRHQQMAGVYPKGRPFCVAGLSMKAHDLANSEAPSLRCAPVGRASSSPLDCPGRILLQIVDSAVLAVNATRRVHQNQGTAARTTGGCKLQAPLRESTHSAHTQRANIPCLHPPLWGNVCPARAWRATFLLTIPTSAPDFPSHGEAPQVDHVALHTFPTKHIAQ